MDLVASLGRMSVSLVAVLGLLYLLSRWVRRSRAGSAASSGEITVLNRAAVGHKAGVAVVKVGDRALVLGVTEAHVSLLAETTLEAVTAAPVEKRSAVRIPLQPSASEERDALDLGALDLGALDLGGVDLGGVDLAAVDLDGLSAAAATPVRGPRAARRAAEAEGHDGALAGSAISPQTWIKAVDVLRDRTARR